MKYLKTAGIALLAFLFFNGIQAVHGEWSKPTEKVVFIEAASSESQKLKIEVERLNTIAKIRDVLDESNIRKSPEDRRDLIDAIYEASMLYDLDIELVLAIIKTESSYNPMATSHVGAQGLMQVMPRTGIALSQEMALDDFNTGHLFDIRTNVMLGTYYMRKLLNRYDDLDNALTAYNAGPTRLDNVLAGRGTMVNHYAAKVIGEMERISRNYF